MVTVNLALPFAALSVGEAMELFQQLLNSGAAQKRQDDRPKFLGVTEFCAITGYSRSTVYNLIKQNKVPFHRAAHGGRKIFFKTDEIEEWLTQNSENTVADYCREMEEKLVR